MENVDYLFGLNDLAILDLDTNEVIKRLQEIGPNQMVVNKNSQAAYRDLMKRVERINSNREPNWSACYMEAVQKITEHMSFTLCGYLVTLISLMKMNNDGLLEKNGKPMNQKMIREEWGLGERQTRENLKKLQELKVLRTEGRKYFINEEFHTMGEIVKDLPFAKLYHKKTKEMSQKVGPETLGMLYKIIPFVNLRTGSLCLNPTEKDINKVDFLIKEGLAEILECDEDTVTKHMDALSEHGAVHVTQVGNTLNYKVHPDFVSRLDTYYADAIRVFIEENQAIARQQREKRSRKKEKRRQ